MFSVNKIMAMILAIVVLCQTLVSSSKAHKHLVGDATVPQSLTISEMQNTLQRIKRGGGGGGGYGGGGGGGGGHGGGSGGGSAGPVYFCGYVGGGEGKGGGGYGYGRR